MSTPLPPHPRSHQLDNLRTFLTLLVIYHHTAISYGGSGNWGYASRYHRPLFSPPLTAFNALNQTFFMGTFFLLSGHFSALAVRKRTRAAFLVDKSKRLGVPAVMYAGVGTLTERLIVDFFSKHSSRDLWMTVLEHLASLSGLGGPLWYCVVLLVFDVVYAALRPGDFALTGQGKDQGRAELIDPPSQRSVLIVLGLVSLSSFFIRLYYPCGRQLRWLSLSPGYLPQYVAAYVIGIAFAPRDPSTLISAKTRMWLLLIAATATVTGVACLKYSSSVTEGSYDPRNGALEAALGGWNLLAVLYALWNESLGMVISSVLTEMFRRFADRRWGDLARYSYAAFLVHKPTVVFWQCVFDGWDASGVVKSVGVGTVGCVASWANGWVLVRAFEGVGLKGFM
jgi:hypothetical protein